MSKPTHILMIIITLSIVFILGLVFFIYTVNLFVNQTRKQGLIDIMHIYDDISSAASPVNFQEIAMVQARIIPAHIVIVDTDFFLLADSHKPIGEISGKFISAELSEAKHMSYSVSVLRSSKTRNMTVSVAQLKNYSPGKVLIQLVYSVDQVRYFFIAFISFASILFLILLALVFFLVSFSVRRYQKPIRKLLQHTKNPTRGGFSRISVDTTNAELTQLVENFNNLVDQHNLLIESDNKKYSRINTLLSNMRAGILMVDVWNTITLVNPQAEMLLDLNKARLFKDSNESEYEHGIINRILSETRQVNEQKTHRDISITTKVNKILDINIQVIFNKYSPYEHSGALVIIQDVTEMRRLERLKDEFASSVSHEFRTPLTVISGFTETLKSWELLGKEDRNTALNIIEVETERLKKLVSDLMFLSHIEGDMANSIRSTINPREITHEVVTALQPLCEKKKHRVSLNIQKDIQPIHGMTGWFRQILFNLYDNAIKYTPAGGHLGIDIHDKENSLIIDIKDSGPGIPISDRLKIFERFYRGDKSRNSKISGSGLGLSITEQMVIEFKGTVEVISNSGGGSVFRVIIPRSVSYE